MLNKAKKSSIAKPYFIMDNEKSFRPSSVAIQDINKETEDLLNASIYSNAIKKAIEKAPINNGTFIMGLFGEWGIGKSTIIKNVKEDLERQNKKEYKFVVYDAWKFVKDSFRRAFLLHLIDELKLKKEPYVEKLYTNKSEEQETKLTYNSKKFWYFIVLPWVIWLIPTIIGFCYFYDKSVVISALCNSFIIPFALNLICSLRLVFDELKTTKQTNALFSAEQFTECFSDILEKSLKSTNPMKRFRNWVLGTPCLDKLIIVIDNIDRCNPETTYELLSTIKTFLVNHNNLILIIPVDEDALCEHLQKRFDNKPDRPKEFLRKIFNLEVRIKPLESVELYSFASRINQDYNLGFSSDAIDMISKEFASNPRRIIQFFNNARTEWDIITQRIKDFSEQDIELAKNTMCKLLIIREEWPFYYEQIRKEPEKLLADGYTQQQEGKNVKALNVFLKTSEFYPILTNEFKLNKIISNNNLFDDLPIQAVTNLKSLDTDKITTFMRKSGGNESKVIKYIEKQLENSIRRNIAGTTTSFFKLILQINKRLGGLSEQNNRYLKRVLKGHIGSIVYTLLEKTSVENFADDLIYYTNTLNDSGQSYMFTEIMNDCILPELKSPDTQNKNELTSTDLLFAKLIKGIVNKKLFDKYKKDFCSWKQHIPDEVMDLNDIATTDLQYFVTNEFQENTINNITLTNDDSTLHLNTTTYLLSNFEQNQSIVKKVFTRLNQIYPHYNLGQKSKSIKLLNGILPVLKIIKPQNFVPEISQLIIKLLLSRPYNHNMTKHETYADKDEYIKVIDLLCKILDSTLDARIPDNAAADLNTFMISCLQDIIQREPSIQSNLLTIIETNITNPDATICLLSNLIIGKHTYTDDYCKLLKRLVLWHYDGQDKNSSNYWYINDEKLSTELQNLLSELKTAESTQKALIQDLICYLTKERENSVKTVLQNINDSEIIANLPSDAQNIALQHVYENLETYESDTQMLKLIAKNADAEVINKLVENILLKKMVDSDTKSSALEIFDLIPSKKATKYRKKINALK